MLRRFEVLGYGRHKLPHEDPKFTSRAGDVLYWESFDTLAEADQRAAQIEDDHNVVSITLIDGHRLEVIEKWVISRLATVHWHGRAQNVSWETRREMYYPRRAAHV